MDGTVFESYLDWQMIRRELDVGDDSILKKIYAREEPDHKRLEILEGHEESNTHRTKPIDGIKPFLSFLRINSISPVLVTNNNLKNTDFLLKKFDIQFDDVITREMKLWKPEPDAFNHILEVNSILPSEVIAVGDSHYDVMAADGAGLSAVYILQPSTDAGAAILQRSGGAAIEVEFFVNYIELTGIFKKKYHLK